MEYGGPVTRCGGSANDGAWLSLARALGSGLRGRGFKSHRPDNFRGNMKRLLWLLALLAFLAPVSASASPKTQIPQVEIFVTSWCPYCRKLESFLKQNRIDYTRYDVENDAKGAEEFGRMGGGGVPMARVGKEIIHGYDPEGILAALQASR